MDRKFFQGVTAAFAGGVIGAVAGMSLGATPEWLTIMISALVGGLTGWIVSDVKGFAAGAARTWKKLRPTWRRPSLKVLRPPLENKERFWDIVLVVTLMSSGAFILMWMGPAAELASPGSTILKSLSFAELLLFPYQVAGVFWLLGFFISLPIYWNGRKAGPGLYRNDGDLLRSIKETKKYIVLFCAPVLPFTLVWFGATWAIPWLWKYTIALYRVTVSNYRIAAMVGGSFGAVGGYLFHQPLAGGFLGAAVWLALAGLAPMPQKPVDL